LKIIDECGLLGGKPIDSHIEENNKLALSSRELFDDPTQYKWLIGGLIYLRFTRPELSYVVHVLS